MKTTWTTITNFMGSYNKFLLSTFTIATFLAITFLAGGCTEVDDTLGYELIPQDQEMKFSRHTMSPGGIDSYIRMGNELPTNNSNYIRIGSVKSERFGTISCSYIGQFSYYATRWFDTQKYVDNQDKEGDDKEIVTWEYVVIDSLLKGLVYGYQAKDYPAEISLDLTIDYISGESSIEQKFYVYEVTEPIGPEYTYEEKYPGGKEKNAIKKDIIAYYPYENPRDYADLDRPLFSFTLHNEKTGTVTKTLEIESGGHEYLKRLIGLEEITTPENPSPTPEEIIRGAHYHDDDIFQKSVKGICIAPADKTLDAAIYSIALGERSGRYEPVSLLTVKTNNNRIDGEPSINPDSVMVYYDLSDDARYPFYPSVSMGLIEHDYSGTEINPDEFYKEELGENNVMKSQLYIQSMLGVGGYLWFNDQFIEELRSLLIDETGKEWQAMSVNQAIMRVWLEDDAVPYLNMAPLRLGMYYDFSGKSPFQFSQLADLNALQEHTEKKINQEGKEVNVMIPFDEYMPIPIPDYAYQYESVTSFPYGGYISRSEGKGYFEMNVSSLISTLVNYEGELKGRDGESVDEEELSRGVWLAPALTHPMSSSSGVSVNSQIIFTTDEMIVQNGPKEGQAIGDEDVKWIEIELAYTLLKPKTK